MIQVMSQRILQRFVQVAAIAGLVFSISNCAMNTPQGRIQKNPAAFAALSSAEKSLVEQGKIQPGMTREAVVLAWGKPSAISERGGRGQSNQEVWKYMGHYPVYTDRLVVGGGYNYRYHGRGYCGPGIYFEPTVEYLPYLVAVVEFANGRVMRWERVKP